MLASPASESGSMAKQTWSSGSGSDPNPVDPLKKFFIDFNTEDTLEVPYAAPWLFPYFDSSVIRR